MKTKHERSHFNRSWREMSQAFDAIEERIDDCIRDIGWDFTDDELDMLEALLRSIERARWAKQADLIRVQISLIQGRIARSK